MGKLQISYGFGRNSQHQLCGSASGQERGCGEVTPIYSAIKRFLSWVKGCDVQVQCIREAERELSWELLSDQP